MEGKYKAEYDELIIDINRLKEVQVPRCLFQKGNAISNIQVHGFSDASETVYAAVVYLPIGYETGEVTVRFLASKAK